MSYRAQRSLRGMLAIAVISAVGSAQAVSDDVAVQLFERLNELEQEITTLRGENESLRDRLLGNPTRAQELEQANRALSPEERLEYGLEPQVDQHQSTEQRSDPFITPLSIDEILPLEAVLSASGGVLDTQTPASQSQPVQLIESFPMEPILSYQVVEGVQIEDTQVEERIVPSPARLSSVPQAPSSVIEQDSSAAPSNVESSLAVPTPTPTPTLIPTPVPIAAENARNDAVTVPDDVNPAESYYFYGDSDPAQASMANVTVTPAPTARPTSQSEVSATVESSSVASLPPEQRIRAEYHEAYRALVNDPASSVPAFRAFLVNYPKHELAGNAQYWLGEALYAQRNFEGATQEFLKVLREYPDSSKAPGAALKLGYSFYELRQWEFARRTLEDTIKFFPDSNSARLAAIRLQRMRDGGHI